MISGEVEDKIKQCFYKAINVARSQNAKSLELRATVDLSCLLRKRGQPDEAREMLQKITSWFTEGFDTTDVVKAKAMLKELS